MPKQEVARSRCLVKPFSQKLIFGHRLSPIFAFSVGNFRKSLCIFPVVSVVPLDIVGSSRIQSEQLNLLLCRSRRSTASIAGLLAGSSPTLHCAKIRLV
jgi:hypothetical protein